MRAPGLTLLVLILTVLAGCADAEPPPPTVDVGQSIVIRQPNGDKSTVTALSIRWTDTGIGEPSLDPSEGAYLIVDIDWSGQGSYNPLYIEFEAGGEEYSSFSGAVSGQEPQLQSGKLNGSTARGYVVFDAPRDPGEITLMTTRHEHAGSWTVPG